MVKKIQAYIRTHKKNSIIIGICVLVIILAAIAAIVLFAFKKNESRQSQGNALNSENWENLITDLENEPVSENDVVYKDESSSKEKPYLIKVNKTQNYVIIYQKDKSGEYTVPLKAMICSVGYDTPAGTFTTSNKYNWKIVNGNVWAQYATRITGNVLFHSMPYSSNDKNTLLTDYYNQMGSTLSASCIRLSAKDANWIMVNCPKETTVVIYESTKEEPLERPASIKVPDDAGWDPTDPDENNPWNEVQLKFDGLSADRTVERGTQVNLLDGIKALDTCGNDITSKTKVTTSMDVFVPGNYSVKYEVEDAAGKNTTATVNYQVADTTAPQFCGLKDNMNFTSVSDVTKSNILDGVSILDNNEILSINKAEVVIPAIVEGTNIITLSVSDDYGNVTTKTVNAIVDAKPPVITLKSGVSSVLALTQTVDETYALSRVTAVDDGITMPSDRISVTITPLDWGYTIQYRATDDKGNVGTLKDTVTYVEYSIVIDGDTTVTDLSDYTQMTKNMTIKSSTGGTLKDVKVQIAAKDNGDGKYTATYTYTYTSPLGEKTARTEAAVTLKKSSSSQQPAKPTEASRGTAVPATDSPSGPSKPKDKDHSD